MRTKEHDKRHISKRSHSPRTSVFSRIRPERSRSPIKRERSRSPRQKAKEGGVFKMLGSRGKSVSAHSASYNQHSYSRYTEALSESEDSGGRPWKARTKKKKSSGEEDDLSQPWAWYLDDGTIVGDTLVIGKVLDLITEDGPRCGLHLNVDKTELFWPNEDHRSRLEGVFPPNISRPLHGVKLLGGPVSVDADFSSALVMKRVSKTIGLLDAVAKINDPQWFDDWQWRLATLPFSFGGLGIYSAGDVLNYAFIASRLQSDTLQTKPLRCVGIVTSGSTFDDALCVFNNAMQTDFLSNPSEMALWQSQREDHTTDWLRVVLIFGLGQTMNGKTYRSVLCYRLGVPLFFVSKLCSDCSRVFTGDTYRDHAVSCAGIIGIKHRHNAAHDTLVDICFRSGISADKEVDNGLGGGRDKALRPADMLLYSWDVGRDVCVDLTGSSPLTQTEMIDFVSGRAVLEAAQRKCAKYEAKCADIGYGFLPFSFSSLGVLENDVVTLMKWIRKFSVAQDIGARAAIHIFNKIGFSIAKGVGPQLGLDVCVDLTGSSPLTQTGMADFVPVRAVIDAAQCKRVKYEAKCAAIGYGFLPFSFSSLVELEGDVVTLLKRIRKFSMTQDVGASAAIHIFNMIGFVIAKGVGAQLVSRLPTNFL
nr:hypothetical protein [Tanacetum cinerariifolium]